MAKIKRKKSRSYDAFLLEQLKDSRLAADYLTASLEEGDLELFLVALRNIADARGGIGSVAEISKLNRQSMYKMFSERGNPKLSSLVAVLDSLGLNLSFSPQEKSKKVA